jgi:hypothetical protein
MKFYVCVCGYFALFFFASSFHCIDQQRIREYVYENYCAPAAGGYWIPLRRVHSPNSEVTMRYWPANGVDEVPKREILFKSQVRLFRTLSSLDNPAFPMLLDVNYDDYYFLIEGNYINYYGMNDIKHCIGDRTNVIDQGGNQKTISECMFDQLYETVKSMHDKNIAHGFLELSNCFQILTLSQGTEYFCRRPIKVFIRDLDKAIIVGNDNNNTFHDRNEAEPGIRPPNRNGEKFLYLLSLCKILISWSTLLKMLVDQLSQRWTARKRRILLEKHAEFVRRVKYDEEQVQEMDED